MGCKLQVNTPGFEVQLEGVEFAAGITLLKLVLLSVVPGVMVIGVLAPQGV